MWIREWMCEMVNHKEGWVELRRWVVMSGGASHGVTPHTVCAATGNAWPPAHSLVSYMHMVARVGELVMQKRGRICMEGGEPRMETCGDGQ